MDPDLPSGSPTQHQPGVTGNLLSNLPNRLLTAEEPSLRGHGNTSVNSGHGNSSQVGVVISKIEDIFESITDSILYEKKAMEIRLDTRKRSAYKTAPDANAIGDIEGFPHGNGRAVKFPSKNPQEAWKFTALLRILELIHDALVTGIVTTKRDMYYRDPELFMKQSVVDRYVDDIAYTFRVPRDALNVVAAAKGLIAGAIVMTKNNNSIVDYGSELEGILIPNSKEITSIQLLDVQWILVIEKEATFRTLSTTEYYKTSLAGKGIIITAKGYPDVQTRQFLHFLSVQAPHIPIYCLVDFDPDGIGIMSTYKYGSIALAYENANLAVSSVQWLGVRSCDTLQRAVDKTGLLKLTKRDRRIAMRMLEKDVFEEYGKEVEWRRELQTMLMLNLKAEIQALSSDQGGLEGWLDGRLTGRIDQV